jgi:hypothetical protein
MACKFHPETLDVCTQMAGCRISRGDHQQGPCEGRHASALPHGVRLSELDAASPALLPAAVSGRSQGIAAMGAGS